MALFAIINILILFLLAGLHLYWACGGKWAYEYVIPRELSQRFSFNPGRVGALVVACGLALFGVVTAGYFTDFGELAVGHYIPYALGSIGAVFLARAVGDFRLMGLFKRIKGSTFAKYDTMLFTPLCLYLAATSFLLAFVQ